jgi:hypothetical protein
VSQLCLELAEPSQPKPKAAPKLSAADEVRRALMDMLPPGVPPFFARIVTARFDGKKRATAELELFDGDRGVIEVWQHAPECHAHRWIRLEGGDLSFENGRWQRVTEAAA